jgi:Asp-tRNA(Asn)/Glu-tRNA(Gln) amidotransferase A subunit family amidase
MTGPMPTTAALSGGAESKGPQMSLVSEEVGEDLGEELRRVAEQDLRVRAFACVGSCDGPVSGSGDRVPLGVKDVFDVAGLPTTLGTVALPARVASRTAAAVTALQQWGAVVVGKTVTSEFAYFGAAMTRNPWNPAYSPGGSSTGSAAAVAAGEVPLAIGSQTNGSVIRPASFCGVVGVKPSYGTIPADGTFLFAPTFDTVGSFARSVRLAGIAADVMAGGRLGYQDTAAQAPPSLRGVRLGVVRTGDWSRVTGPMQRLLDGTVDLLAGQGVQTEEVVTALCDEEALVPYRTIFDFEGHQSLQRLGMRRLDLVGDKIADFLRDAARVTAAEYESALRRRSELVARFDAEIAGLDAVITVPAAGEAPLAGDNGDPRFCTRWSMAGVPAVCLPAGLGSNGLPMGIQLVGSRRSDAALLRLAAGVEELLGFREHHERLDAQLAAAAR